MKFNIVVLNDGSLHINAFAEITQALQRRLSDLGHQAFLFLSDSFMKYADPQAVLIAVGVCRNPKLELPARTIIYNLEQIGSGWFTAELVDLYNQYPVWDYSAVNASRYSEVGLKPAVATVSFCFHESLNHFDREDIETCDIDVVHVGWSNPRRDKILQELRSHGLIVEHVDNKYGQERDAVLVRAKLLINIHFYEASIQEKARIIYALANGVAVLTEESCDEDTFKGVPYSDLVNECLSLVRYKPREFAESEFENLACHAIEQFNLLPEDAARGEAELKLALSTVVETAAATTKLVLSMVCTDEPKVIRRAITSALPHIQAWCISYNGTPGGETVGIINELLGHLPGSIVAKPWVSYGHNRTEALELAKEFGTHALILDADEIIESWQSVDLTTADGFEVEEHMGTFFNPKVRIVSLSKSWKYVGAVHEYIDSPGAKLVHAPIRLRNLRDGAGSEKPSQQRYLEEAKMLEEQLAADPTDTRAQFYLAQSYELAGDLAKAYQGYTARSKMGGFAEEAWMALVRIAQMHMRTPGQDAFVPVACLRAWQERPRRAEPLFYLARWYRQREHYDIALMLIKRVAAIAIPMEDRLHVDLTLHAGGWQVLDELSLALYRTGYKEEAKSICTALLPLAPAHEQERIIANLQAFCV